MNTEVRLKNTKRSAILAVSFGTSWEAALKNDIGAIEADLAAAFPEREVRRAFTSGMVIKKLGRSGIAVDTVAEALAKLADEGVNDVVIQPTHVLPGHEFELAESAAKDFAGRFERLKLAAPLLVSGRDYDEVADVLIGFASEQAGADTAVVFMGHGSQHSSNDGYELLARRIAAKGGERIFIGTVEAAPGARELCPLIVGGGYKRVVLAPLLIVAGDHANNDMAGPGEDSWKSVFEAGGLKVDCVIRGLGENADIRRVFVRHASEAVSG